MWVHEQCRFTRLMINDVHSRVLTQHEIAWTDDAVQFKRA